ncbi:hypothetical protein Sme01_56320 [Sphaerisporangium melleum]|uniref:Uncharacterized protein n=1 Tax=Sphaerisporangium melleum TaxID=321316 RepID=A0A917VPH5_9ACTN|nr:hypothetical protein [Sphaerisporangium melleum]GGL05833.1 hypothetical protein GCM10007964_55110 [Sphaerisporangium melleum]GII73156.1 hypothetical protein Sme01_56320 [Sphaerisporangium melleum]
MSAPDEHVTPPEQAAIRAQRATRRQRRAASRGERPAPASQTAWRWDAVPPSEHDDRPAGRDAGLDAHLAAWEEHAALWEAEFAEAQRQAAVRDAQERWGAYRASAGADACDPAMKCAGCPGAMSFGPHGSGGCWCARRRSEH